jgi:phenylalanyl-tRNA synthetase beta chain
MLVPLRWLRELVDHGLETDRLAELLTMAGLEVEGVERRFPWAGKVVTARVVGVEPHPNADKLRLATVDTGAGRETIVCGAPNLTEGMMSALAVPGAVLAEGLQVAEAKIRGVASRGMLCSQRELGISADHSGIVELPAELAPGRDLVEALGLENEVMEVAVTPNRGDALSILGVARDVAALSGRPLAPPRPELAEEEPGIESQASVTIADPQGCPRYAARLVRGVETAPSPLWMADRLSAAGVRPINNVVDVTNYVLLELGQPLHAFDFRLLAGGRIHVRPAEEGEVFTTLDGQERRLEAGMLLICDAERPVALAGVMGGLNSEIGEKTDTVLIESAFFDPGLTRRTSRRLGLSTEASYRFERGVDREGCAAAADRAAQLMARLAGGKVARGVIDAYPLPYQAPRLELSVGRTSAFLGLSLSRRQVAEPLQRLGIALEDGPDEDRLVARPPAARTDLERPVDLTEEVARLVGYDNIPAKLPWAPLAARPRARRQVLRDRARELMAGQGLDEAISLSFAHPQAADWLRLAPDDPRRRAVRLMNPLSEEQSELRTTLLPGLLAAVRRNLSFSVLDVGLFEVGKVFRAAPGQRLPEEPERLAGALAGLAQPVSWHSGEEPVSLAHAKGAVEYLLDGLGVAAPEFPSPAETPPCFEPGTWCAVRVEGREIGQAGRLHAKAAAAWDLDQPVYLFELDFDALVELAPESHSYAPLPRYPAVVRDVAMVVDEAVGAGEVLAAARRPSDPRAGKWLAQVELFDLYRGKPLAKGRKSLALRFAYRSGRRTLTEEEVRPAHQALVDELLQRFGGVLRQ